MAFVFGIVDNSESFLGCFASQQYDSVSQGRMWEDSCMCSHTETELLIKLAVSRIHSILTPDPPVLALTLERQAFRRVATRVPLSKSLVMLELEKHGERSIEGSLSLSRQTLHHEANEAVCSAQ